MCGPEVSGNKMNVGPFTWKGSRFRGTLPDGHLPIGHTMPDAGSQISPNRLNSRKWTEQTAGPQTNRFQPSHLSSGRVIRLHISGEPSNASV